MSARLFPDDILFFQRLLKCDGLYAGRLDGVWGPLTDAAVSEFERRADDFADSVGSFDPRSENNIRTLSLKAQPLARAFLARLSASGIRARIISGTRTYAMQDALYRKGRFGYAGPIVTNARGGQSNHNFGIAWDIGVFTDDGGYITDAEAYAAAAGVALSGDLEWGGSWQGFVDNPHYQLRLPLTLAAVRGRFEAGDALTAIA